MASFFPSTAMEVFVANKVWRPYGADHADDDNRPVRPTSLSHIYGENGSKSLLYNTGTYTPDYAGPQWPRGPRRRSAAARRSWVRIPPEVWMFVVSVVR